MPGIPSQTMPLPLSGGLSQKVDPRWQEVGTQTTLTNISMVKANVFAKRWGFSALGINNTSGTAFWGTANASLGYRIGSYTNQLWQIGQNGGTQTYNTGISSYFSTRDQWQAIDYVSECNAYRTPIVEWNIGTNTYDAVVGNDYIVAVYTSKPYSASTYSVYATVQHASSGAVRYSNYLVSVAGTNTSVVRTCLVYDGTNYQAVVVWYDKTATTDIYANTLNLTTLTWGSATKIVSLFDAAADEAMWDICPIDGTNDRWAIVYAQNNGGTKKTALALLNTALTVVTSTTFGPPAAHNSPGHGYAITADSNNIWTAVCYDDGANSHIYVRASNPTTLAAILAETDLQVNYTGTAKVRLTGIYSNSSLAWFVTSNRNSTVGTRWRGITTAGTRGVSRTMFNYDVASKPFVYQNVWYVTLAQNTSLVAYTQIPPVSQTSPQGTYQLVDIGVNSASTSTSVGRPVATLAPRIANTAPTSSNWSSTVPTAITSIATGQFLTVGSVVSNTSTRFGLQTLVYDFTGDRWSHVELGGSMYMSGGVPSVFDSQQVTEIGFLHPPPNVTVATSIGAGGLTPSASYTWYIQYLYPDANGNIVRSASAIASATMGAADNTATLTIINNACTTKQDPENGFNTPIGIQVYRNVSTGGVQGSVFYQLLSDSAVLVNDPQTYSQSFVDLQSDATVPTLGFGQWQYAGGQVEGYCPGAIQKLVAYNQRLFGIGDDRRTLVFSTALVLGEQPRFSDSFRIPVPDVITGLEVQDGVLFIWTKDAIYRMAGNGPNEQATQTDFGPLQIVSNAGGCIDSRSVLSTHIGIFFQSKNGIQLLGRDGTPQYVGGGVEDTLASYSTIVAATHLPHRTEVRFECQNSAATSGVTLVFNYTFKAWFVHDRWDSDKSLATSPAQSACVVNGTYYWSNSTGAVFKENNDATLANAFTDAGHWVTLSVQSALAKANGLTGWALWRYVLVAGESMSPHDLHVTILTNYGTSDSDTFRADSIDSWSDSLELAEIQVVDQRSPVLQVTVSDSTPSGMAVGTGQGLKLLGLQLDVGMTPGRYRFPRDQTI